MEDVLFSLALFIVTIGATLATRGRPPLIQIATETALLIAIGLFLLDRGTSPLPLLGLHRAMLPGVIVPVGMVSAWYRALAVVWWLIGARLVVNVAMIVRGRDPRSREARLFSELTAATIYITAVLIILNSVLGLNITSLLATSGIVAIVVGLALQNTLADVFSGIAVGLEQPFHVGDLVSLGNDIEGTIVQMNWRSVRVQTDDDDLATVPNSLVARGRIINHSVPTRRRAGSIEVPFATDFPTTRVVELLRQATLLCPEILKMPAPSITMRRAGLRSNSFGVRFFVADSPILGTAKSKLLKQICRLLVHAGIGTRPAMSATQLLSALVLFEALAPKDLDELVAHLVTHTFEPDDIVFKQGDASTSIFVVAAGVLEITRHTPHGTGESVGHIGPGEYVGEIGLITGQPRSRGMRALTQCRVLEIPGTCLHDLLKTNTALNAAMELSVRRGLASLDRDDAAREAQHAEQTPDLLARIKSFFGLNHA